MAAAGSGDRLGAEHPKAFVRLGELPMLAESLRRLDDSDWVDAIVVAVPPGWEEPAILLAEEVGCGKVSACVTGGATRAESVRIALAEVPDDAVVVLVHDAARPFLPEDVLERVLTALGEGWDGAVPALEIPDTVKRVEERLVVETLDRGGLVAVQTPQAFLAPVLRRGGRARRGHGLRVARRALGRPRHLGAGRPAAAQGHDEGGPRARRVVALKAVFFDVGETLVDEERYWRRIAEAVGVRPHVLWAALGVTIARGEEHRRVFDYLGVEAVPGAPAYYEPEDLYPDALPAIAGLRERGLFVGVAGNQSARARGAGSPREGWAVDYVASSAAARRRQAGSGVLRGARRCGRLRARRGRVRRRPRRPRRAPCEGRRDGRGACPPRPVGLSPGRLGGGPQG